MSVIHTKFSHIGGLIQRTTHDAANLPHSLTVDELSLDQTARVPLIPSRLVRELNDEGVLHGLASAPYALADLRHPCNVSTSRNDVGKRLLAGCRFNVCRGRCRGWLATVHIHYRSIYILDVS